MNFKRKGEYGYIRSEKKRRLIVTFILFAIPVLIFTTGVLMTGTKATILTVVAVVGCLPACRSLVGFIMMLLRTPMKEEIYEKIRPREGSLTMLYDLYLTTYEKSNMLNACAICGNTVVGLTVDEKSDAAFLEEHMKKTLRADGLTTKVNVLSDADAFVQRLNSMNEHEKELRSNITYRPNPVYPDLGIEGLIKHTLLAVSL